MHVYHTLNETISTKYLNIFFLGGKVSQATAGIVAAIFCAVVFIGVGVLRCIMMGACGNPCHVQNAGETRERHVVGTSESNAYQGDFPPSYSTGKTFFSWLICL